MNLIEDAEGMVADAAKPYALAIKLGAYALAIAALLAAGWFAHGAFDGTKAAQAAAKVSDCHAARATDTANANSAAAGGIDASAHQAVSDNATTDDSNQQRAAGYAGAQDEASHAKPSSATIDVAPLRILFAGMRNTETGPAAASP